ncbi:MAG: magnesium transporter CorA family protein [archaeon]
MISFYKKTNGVKSLKKVNDYSQRSWVHVVNPTSEEVSFLVKEFKLEQEDIEDSLDIYETSRLEENAGNIFIYLSAPTGKISQEATSSFAIIITKYDVITLCRYDLEIFDILQSGKVNFVTSNRISLALRILSHVSRSFDVNTRKIISAVKKERSVITKLSSKDILSLVSHEETLNEYLTGIAPLVSIYDKLLKIKTLRFPKDNVELIEDLINDLKQTYYSCKSALRTISNMRDYYSATMTTNLNRIITILTVFTVFLTVPTIISSIYGMNVLLPGQDSSNIFWLLMILVVAIWAVLITIFKKMRVI